MRIHLDTDFAGDTDDAAALAMLLGWPGAEITGITTVADPDGRRAGYVDRMLGLARRRDIPVAAGAGASLTTGSPMGDLPDHARYWGPDPVRARPSPEGPALDLLAASVQAGAVVVGIGPYTNLALLEKARPGSLRQCAVVVMGGWVRPPAPDLPPWGPEMDWNVQCDTEAALTVARAASDLTLVTLPATLDAHLTAKDLGPLERSGPIGRLLARQARAHAEDNGMTRLGRSHQALPDDLLNFHYDPVACATALGYRGVTVETMGLDPVVDEGVLRFEEAPGGRTVRVVTRVDGQDFSDVWRRAVEAADRPA